MKTEDLEKNCVNAPCIVSHIPAKLRSVAYGTKKNHIPRHMQERLKVINLKSVQPREQNNS